MKNILFLILLMILNSCQAQKTEDRIKTFNQNRHFFDSVAIFMDMHREELELTGKNQAVFIDKSLLSNPKYQNIHKEKMKYFFDSNLIKEVSIYKQGSIEFLIGFESNNLRLTETKKYYMYTSEKELPSVYNHWSKKIQIDANWWYLEYTDSQY